MAVGQPAQPNLLIIQTQLFISLVRLNLQSLVQILDLSF